MAQPLPADETLNHLHRLTQKPGVQATLILSRATGSIVRSSGLTSLEDELIEPESTKIPVSSTDANGVTKSPTINATDGTPSAVTNQTPTATGANNTAPVKSTEPKDNLAAEEIAKKVFQFFSHAMQFAEGMDVGRGVEREGDTPRSKDQDEVRLLRLRLRRKEIVIVPDARFLLVVIHDTPFA